MEAQADQLGKTQNLPDGVLYQVTADVDFHNSYTMRDELMKLLRLSPKRLVVDMAAMKYMDSSGLAVLIESLRQARQQACKFVLCGLQPRVRGVFDIARLTALFTIAEDQQAACAA